MAGGSETKCLGQMRLFSMTKKCQLLARVYKSINFRMQGFDHVFSKALFDNEQV